MNYLYYWLTACSLLASTIATAQQQERKNVLFIIVDDMKPLLGCYGDSNARTPNIDRLAAGSRVFNRAYCQQAVCAPSRASFMTGRRPDQLKVWGLTQPFRRLHPNLQTLPQYFKGLGYTTAAAGKIFHDPPAHQDPASWSLPAVFGVTGNGQGHKYALAEHTGQPKSVATERAAVDDSGYIDGKVAEAALNLLSGIKDKPFFLAVGFRRPHLPFTAPDRYWQPFDGKTLPHPDNSIPQHAPAIALHRSQELRGYTDIPDSGAIAADKVSELLKGYYAAVSYTDAQIGKLLDALEAHGLMEHTIVVLFSDHGFHLGEQGMWGKSTNFENAARVPLLIRAPGTVQHPGKTQAIAELVDLYPTLLELCGLQIPGGLAGNSLVPALRDTAATVKTRAISQFIRPYEALSKESRISAMGYSLRTARYRFTEWYDVNTHTLMATELYDHQTDAAESINQAGEATYAGQVEQLHRELQAVISPGH